MIVLLCLWHVCSLNYSEAKSLDSDCLGVVPFTSTPLCQSKIDVNDIRFWPLESVPDLNHDKF